MYIRLTSRCNMTCGHCAFSCTSRGQDMDTKTFRAALDLAQEYGEYITLGGGEPTLHPQFWEFFGMAMASQDEEGSIHIVTNGKITDTAIALAKLARAGVIGAALSQDQYHDVIDPAVIRAFTKGKHANTMYGYVPRYEANENDHRSINQLNYVIAAGRGKKLGGKEICFCDDLMVEPNGDLWACGCRTKRMGTVFEPTDELYEYFNGDEGKPGCCGVEAKPNYPGRIEAILA